MSVKNRVVLLAGGTSAAGVTVARTLLAMGAQVVIVGRDLERAHQATDVAGGGGLAGQTDADWAFLEVSLTSLRHVSRVFFDDVAASPVGRLAIVSSTSVAKPLAGSANYTTLKAAAESWTLAVDQGFAKTARDAGAERTAAAAIVRVTSLDGLEQRLADAFVGLFDRPAAEVGGSITTLT